MFFQRITKFWFISSTVWAYLCSCSRMSVWLDNIVLIKWNTEIAESRCQTEYKNTQNVGNNTFLQENCDDVHVHKSYGHSYFIKERGKMNLRIIKWPKHSGNINTSCKLWLERASLHALHILHNLSLCL